MSSLTLPTNTGLERYPLRSYYSSQRRMLDAMNGPLTSPSSSAPSSPSPSIARPWHSLAWWLRVTSLVIGVLLGCASSFADLGLYHHWLTRGQAYDVWPISWEINNGKD